MKTKPRGMWANFQTECVHCRRIIHVNGGRVEPHDCGPTLAEIYTAYLTR